MTFNLEVSGFKFVPWELVTDKMLQRCGWKNKEQFRTDYRMLESDLENMTFPVGKDEFINEKTDSYTQEEWEAIECEIERPTMFLCGSPESRLYSVTVTDFFSEMGM